MRTEFQIAEDWVQDREWWGKVMHGIRVSILLSEVVLDCLLFSCDQRGRLPTHPKLSV